MINGEWRPSLPNSAIVSTVEARVRERIRTVQVSYGSCGKRGNADLFVIDCKNSGAHQQTLVAPGKTNFLTRSVQFPLSNPYL